MVKIRVRNLMSRRLYERNLNDGDLARMSGIARVRINQIKNHRIRPTLRDALQICQALGVSVGQVFVLDGRAARARRP